MRKGSRDCPFTSSLISLSRLVNPLTHSSPGIYVYKHTLTHTRYALPTHASPRRYMREKIKVAAVVSESPTRFLHDMGTALSVDTRPLRFAYTRLNSLLRTLQVRLREAQRVELLVR